MKYILKKKDGKPKHIIRQKCTYCGNDHDVEIKKFEDYARWKTLNLKCQDVFDYLSATEREQLISGLCPRCQEFFFKGDDEDET